MAAPTFVTESESVWNTTTSPKTTDVTVQTGDVLVAYAVSEGNPSGTDSYSCSGGGLTWTQQQYVDVTDYTAVAGWTAVATAGATVTVSISRSGFAGDYWWGMGCTAFRGSDGVGASSKTNVSGSAPTLNLTTTQDNSAIVVVNGDWNAQDGTSRTWRTVNSITPTAGNGYERTYFRDSANYTLYAGYYPDAGAAGSKTVGLSAPGSQNTRSWQSR